MHLKHAWLPLHHDRVVTPEGLEPPSLPLERVRSGPSSCEVILVLRAGLEPAAYPVGTGRSVP